MKLTLEEAYALQDAEVRRREENGDKVIGYKVGCVGGLVQRQLRIKEPIWGRVFANGCLSPGVRLSHAAYKNLAVEGEWAVRLADDWPAEPCSDEDCLTAIETIVPVIELHNYDLGDIKPRVAALVASNGMHAGLVLPDKSPSGLPRVLPELELNITGLIDTLPEMRWEEGPLPSLRWLAERLAERGERLRGGQLILTGSLLPLYPVHPQQAIFVTGGQLGISCAIVDP